MSSDPINHLRPWAANDLIQVLGGQAPKDAGEAGLGVESLGFRL